MGAYSKHGLPGRFLAGDESAVGEVGRWIAEVLASSRFWAIRRYWSDLHQEILGRVTESLRAQRFDPSRNFRAYVQGMARFTASRAMSHELREIENRGSSGGPEPVAFDRADRLYRMHLAREILDRCSPECRDLIRAYFFEQSSYREIADRKGVPVGTVKSRLFRCLRSALASLERDSTRRDPRPEDA